MTLVATDTGTTFTPPPAGTHLAYCCQVIDLGTQHSKFYDKFRKRCLIGWELPNEMGDDDTPLLVWREYTVSLGENATLRAHLQSWRGREFTEEELKGFHLKKILGVPCMINITHRTNDGKTYGDVAAVMALPKGQNLPPAYHKTLLFEIENWDDEVFKTFGEKLQKKIMDSSEGKAKHGAPAASGAGAHTPLAEDDIPF